MRIVLGLDSKKMRNDPEIYWDTKALINGHMLIVGKSGTGKTFTIRKILNGIYQYLQEENLQIEKYNRTASENQQKPLKKVRVHILDVHGDIDIDSEDKSILLRSPEYQNATDDNRAKMLEELDAKRKVSTVKFSEQTSYGFNPLLINKNLDFGGVRKRIQSFISSLNRTGFRLGGNQESTLRNLLIDLYEANGIFEKDPHTWDVAARGKRMPTIEDLSRFTQNKMRTMYLGANSNCTSALIKVNKEQAKLKRLQRKMGKVSGSEVEELEEKIAKSKEDLVAAFTDYVGSIETGKELEDALKYDSFDTMKSLANKIENLNNIGIFKNERPPFERDKDIWRYDIKSLDNEEKALFVSFLCEQIFYRRLQGGERDDVEEIIVLDESHLFVNDDPKNPINMIAKEARKFGLALFAASQSPTHFSEDFLSNVSTKIILGIDTIYWTGSINRLKLTEEALKWIIFHKRILIQLNTKGDSKNDFIWSYNGWKEYEDVQKRMKAEWKKE